MDRRAWWATVPWDLKESDTTEQLTVSPVYSLSWESNWFKLRVLFICPYQRRQCCWEFYLNSNQFAYKGLYRQSYGFSRNHIWMWELDHKEGWIPKNWCFWTVVLEKTLESPLDSKEIKPVDPKEINSEYSLEGLVLKLKLQYFGYLMWRADSWEKALMLGKIEGKRRSGQQRMR